MMDELVRWIAVAFSVGILLGITIGIFIFVRR